MGLAAISGRGVAMDLLVVDDDHDAADALGELLRQLLGASVTVAHSGFEAVSIALHASLDAVVTDIEMPGMDGIEMAQEIRWGPRSPRMIVAVSGRADVIDPVQLTVFDNVFAKPVRIDVLVDCLRAA
jgi:CheY-like chemotaxis protein